MLYDKNGCDNDDTVEAYYQGTPVIDYDRQTLRLPQRQYANI
jgi:hypothetical protein